MFLDTYGHFDINSPPAPDLTVNWVDFPLLMSDVLTMLTDTGACDVWVDPLEGSGSTIGRLNAVTQAGNASSIVHFDYGMGDYSIAQISRTKDMETICNKLRYLLGIRDGNRWPGSIEATNADLPDPPQTAIDALIAASRADFGVYMDVKIHDDTDYVQGTTSLEQRPMFYRLWQNEALFRVTPREMLSVTPVNDPPFGMSTLGLGDTITINCSDAMREAFTAQQRVYGLDCSISENGVTSITEILTSPS
jgi:hypothetical protein